MFRVLENLTARDPVDSWSVPWALVEQWRSQIERNHGQTLERLHERGGLSPDELWLAAHGKRWSARPAIESRGWLRSVAADYVAPSYWPNLLARVLYVPGMCAAIGQREWCNAGDRELTKALDDGALPSYWPTWAVKP